MISHVGIFNKYGMMVLRFDILYKVPLRDVGGMKSGGVSQVEKGDACETLAPLFLVKMISE